jgi:hypothetical protein
MGRAVAKITHSHSPIFANQQIGADQGPYFAQSSVRRNLSRSPELGNLCLAWSKIRVSVADASFADH